MPQMAGMIGQPGPGLDGPSNTKATAMPGSPGHAATNIIDQKGGLDPMGMTVDGNNAAGVSKAAYKTAATRKILDPVVTSPRAAEIKAAVRKLRLKTASAQGPKGPCGPTGHCFGLCQGKGHGFTCTEIMYKRANGDMLQYFQDNPQKLKEKKERDAKKAKKKTMKPE